MTRSSLTKFRVFLWMFLSVDLYRLGSVVSEEKITMWKVYDRRRRQRRTTNETWWQKLTWPMARWAKNDCPTFWRLFSMIKMSKIRGYRSMLMDTILKGTHPGTIPARFGLIWFSGFREDLNVISQPNFAEMILGWSSSKNVSSISDLRPRWPPQPNLIWTDGRRTKSDDNSSLGLKARWAKKGIYIKLLLGM
jgi:hypothetical protein